MVSFKRKPRSITCPLDATAPAVVEVEAAVILAEAVAPNSVIFFRWVRLAAQTINVVPEAVKASQAGRHVSNRLLRLEVLERLLWEPFFCLTISGTLLDRAYYIASH